MKYSLKDTSGSSSGGISGAAISAVGSGAIETLPESCEIYFVTCGNQEVFIYNVSRA